MSDGLVSGHCPIDQNFARTGFISMSQSPVVSQELKVFFNPTFRTREARLSYQFCYLSHGIPKSM